MNSMADNARVRSEQRKAATGRKALRSGYLMPGDMAGADSDGLQDYRGIELPDRLVGALSSGMVPIGRLRNPRTRFTAEAWLPWEILNTHVAIVAPTGSGKTHGLIVPWILGALNAGVRVIASDVTGALLPQIQEARKATGGPIFSLTRWNPFNKAASSRWNPLLEVSDDTSRVRLAAALVGDPDKVDSKDKFFVERDQRWLDGLIKLALGIRSDATLNDIYELLSNKTDLEDLIDSYPSLSRNIAELVGMSDQDYSLAIGSLKNKLVWFSYENPREVTKESKFRLEDIIETPGLLLIGAPLSEGEPAKAAAAMAFAMLRSVTFRRFGQHGLPNAWIIDEAPTLAERIALDDTLATARAAGVGITIAFQDVAQFGDEKKQSRYLSNCRTFITLRDVSESTGNHLKGRLGKHSVEKVSTSVDSRGRRLPQRTTESVPVLEQSEIASPPADFGVYPAIIHCPGLGGLCSPPAVTNRPFIVDLSR